MKINKSDPRHWWYLTVFGLNVLLAMLLRPFLRTRGGTRIILYGHKLNGNLLALYRELRRSAPDARTVFLTMDPVYHRALRRNGYMSLCVLSPACAIWLASGDAVVSDHGLHAMQPMVRFTDLMFFDVWHGIPFKGFDDQDFRLQHGYDEVWVASPLHKALYTERYGFDDRQVAVTGYARTDRLVRRDEDMAALRRNFGVPEQGRLVLFAPTWAQDARGRNIYPFGASESDFLDALSDVAARNGATILMRAHLNTGIAAGRDHSRVIAVPQGSHPDTEGLLLISDVLICDWSSIAFDYLLLERPTIFLDVPHPFRKGFSLGPEYRFGAIVADMPALLERLEDCLFRPDAYRREFGSSHAEVRLRVYDRYADGNAAKRCAARLMRHIASAGSSRSRR